MINSIDFSKDIVVKFSLTFQKVNLTTWIKIISFKPVIPLSRINPKQIIMEMVKGLDRSLLQNCF